MPSPCGVTLWQDAGCMVRHFRHSKTKQQGAQRRIRGMSWAGKAFRASNLPSPLQIGEEAQRRVRLGQGATESCGRAVPESQVS